MTMLSHPAFLFSLSPINYIIKQNSLRKKTMKSVKSKSSDKKICV